jgi:adenine/guanine/hypoxanthine permease
MLKLHPSTWRTEIIAGVTTFITLAYIVVVNPTILSTPGTGLSFQGVLTSTVILSFLMTLFMGIYANLPFAVAPGMGINAFFTFTLIIGKKIPWTVALGMVFWSGILFLLFSILPVRQRIARSIPEGLRHASAVGIGIFITFIGLRNMGLVVTDPTNGVKVGLIDKKCILSLLGLLPMILLIRRKNPFAFLAGIFTVTTAAWGLGLLKTPDHFLSLPDFRSTFFRLDILGALKLELLPAILVLCFTDFFDSVATFIGVSQANGLVDEKGHPKNLNQGMLVDAFATLGGGLFGTSPGTAYIESSAGIEAGGRTGWTAVVTSFCILPCLFVAPVAAMIPTYATAPVLVLVGAMMFRNVTRFTFDKWEDLLPAYLTIVLIPLTFSITQGILWGFIAHVASYVLSGRRKDLDPIAIGVAVVSLGLLWLEQNQ